MYMYMYMKLLSLYVVHSAKSTIDRLELLDDSSCTVPIGLDSSLHSVNVYTSITKLHPSLQCCVSSLHLDWVWNGKNFIQVSKEWKMVMYMYCLLYTSPSPRDATLSRMPSSA